MNDSKAAEKWAVVQELLPFGYRIDKIYDSRKRAEREASASRYLTARPLEWVRSENERLSQPADFTRELHEWSRVGSAMPGEEIEARRQALVDALSLRNKAARWWAIHGLPLVVMVGVFALALVAFFAFLEWWS